MQSRPGTVSYDPSVRSNRTVWIKNDKGDLVGGNFTIPKGDFARFLGFKKPSDKELSGEKHVSGGRVLEMALHRKFNELGPNAMQRGMGYRNINVAYTNRWNGKGSTGDMLNDGLDSIQQSVELNKASNMAYLEMQYKFHWASKSFGTISNIMKVRHESTKKAITEVR